MSNKLKKFLRCFVIGVIFAILLMMIKVSYDSGRADKIPILTFHRIVSDENKKNQYSTNQWVSSVVDFEKQMKFLYDNGYRTISIQEFEKWYDKRIELPNKVVMLTFDDGDYELYYVVLPILKKYNFKATAFIIGSLVEDITEPFHDKGIYTIGRDKINEISKVYPNLQFQSHSYNLHYVNENGEKAAQFLDYDALNKDFKENRKFGFNYIAYPYGKITKDFIEAAKNNDIKLAFGFDKYVCATRDSYRYAIPRIKINGQITYIEYVNKMNSYL